MHCGWDSKWSSDLFLLTMQEDEIKDKNAKIEHFEQCLTTLNLELKVRSLAF